MSERSWHGASVLVTGAAGFLGGWVARRLSDAGARVIGLDNDWPSTAGLFLGHEVDGDVRDETTVVKVLGEHEVDVVIHLAARSLVGEGTADPAETFDTNVRGTWVVLDAARRADIDRIVVASSDKAYGDAGGVAYTEDMPLAALGPYDASKACADVIARSFASSYGMSVVVTRCGNLYGPGDLHRSRIVPGTIHAALRGQDPEIRSDGTYVRDYLYVEDAAGGVLALALAADQEGVRGEAFNLSGSEPRAAAEVARRIVDAIDPTLSLQILGTAENEIVEQRVDAAKIAHTIGWSATTSFDASLERTISWYRDYEGS